MLSLVARRRAQVFLLAGLIQAPCLHAASVSVLIADEHGQALDRAVVAISSTSIDTTATTPTVHLMDQVDKRFVPDVIAISTGDSIRFPNSDDIRHHVYSFSVPLSFELPLYSGEPENPVLFREPGMVIVGCNIHDRMQGNIYIFDKQRYAVSAAGKAEFSDLPDEELTVTIYHPDAIAQPAMEFVLSASELAKVTTAYRIQLKATEQPDTAGMTELQKKFLQLRHEH